MKITNDNEPYEVDVKRFYMPGTTFTGECPKCHAAFEKDLSDEYLSYPMANKTFDHNLWCSECSHEWKVQVRLVVALHLVETDTIPALSPMYDVVRDALIARGWKIDETAVETRSGELREFIDPDTGRRLAWLDAFFRQEEREL